MTTSSADPGLTTRQAFSFAGCTWELTSDCAELVASFAGAFPGGNAEDAAAFRLRLSGNGSKDGLWTSPYFRARDHMVLAAFSASDVMLFDLLAGRGVGTISHSLAKNPDYWRRVIFPAIVGLASPCVGIAPLHCATLVRGGKGLHISGLSGAGKSTLTYALAQRGFQVLSDDWTYFSRGVDGAISASGLPVPIKLLPDTSSFFPELDSVKITRSLNGELAYEIDAGDARSPARTYSCHPDRLLFFRREPEAALTCTRLTPAQVIAQFEPALEILPPSLFPARETQCAIISELANVPAYSLVCDGSPQDTAAWIGDWSARETGLLSTATVSLPRHFEIPDLMLRFVPAPLASRSGRRTRIETDLPLVHRQASAIVRRLVQEYGADLDCTFIADDAEWPRSSSAFGQYAYRFLPGTGCLFVDRRARRLVSFLSPAADLSSIYELVAPAA